jgi:flagellar biosynthesis protein FlhB
MANESKMADKSKMAAKSFLSIQYYQYAEFWTKNIQLLLKIFFSKIPKWPIIHNGVFLLQLFFVLYTYKVLTILVSCILSFGQIRFYINTKGISCKKNKINCGIHQLIDPFSSKYLVMPNRIHR